MIDSGSVVQCSKGKPQKASLEEGVWQRRRWVLLGGNELLSRSTPYPSPTCYVLCAWEPDFYEPHQPVPWLPFGFSQWKGPVRDEKADRGKLRHA